MKAVIEKDRCIGCGLCASICPEVFYTKDEKTTVTGNITEENSSAVEECACSCPVNAIYIEE